MIYPAYQTYADMMQPLRDMAGLISRVTPKMCNTGCEGRTWDNDRAVDAARKISAQYELIALAGLSHRRPKFNIDSIAIGGKSVVVREEIVCHTPFCSLLHFKKRSALAQPRVLLVAPLSGHFATLLRGTVLTMLPDHDVYITDWHNARDIPLSEGRFGLDENVVHLMNFLNFLGPETHVVAVCQPAVPVLAAVALMAEYRNPAQPRSMTLIAGPVDARINPTKVNDLANDHSIGWFKDYRISTVPLRYKGAQRTVYPGFLQLSAFMGMNLERHMNSLLELYKSRLAGDHQKADATRNFYEEYFAAMDLPAEFYLETIHEVFHECSLAQGRMKVHGCAVNPAAIKRTALLTVEGDKDDITGEGQTFAAHGLCRGLRQKQKMHYVQAGAGHYGVFSGSRWETGVYPLLRDMIRKNS